MPKKKKASGQKIISNMGLFWRRDQVRWKGNRGIGRARLAGRRRSAKRKGEVDFWKQTGIYALYAEYDFIYVGQAGLSDQSNLGNRLKHHLTDDLAGRLVRPSDGQSGQQSRQASQVEPEYASTSRKRVGGDNHRSGRATDEQSERPLRGPGRKIYSG